MMRKKLGVWLAAAGLLAAICALAPAEDQTVTPREGTVGTEANGQVNAPKGADTSAAESIIPVEGQPKVTIITRLFKPLPGWSFTEFLTKVVGQKSLWVDVIPGELDGYPLDVPAPGAAAIRVNRVFDEGVTNAGGFPLQLEGNLLFHPPKGGKKPTEEVKKDWYWAVKVAPMVAIQEIQGHPNNDLALNSEFIKQEGTVGVLKGFKVKYIGIVNSPASGDTYTWQYRGHDGQSEPADWTDFGTGLTFIRNEDTVGDYDVRLKLSRGGQDYYSEIRQVMVAEVECLNFQMTNSSDYTRDGEGTSPIIIDPSEPLKVVAKIDFKAGPKPENIKQGFIQGIRPELDIRHEVSGRVITWNPGTPAGAMIDYPFAMVNVHPDPPWVNDSAPDIYLYKEINAPETPPKPLGQDLPPLKDAPTTDNETVSDPWVRANGTVRCTYSIVKRKQWIDARVWLVVVVENAADNLAHYIPIKTQAWQLHLDSTNANKTTWQCEKIGSPEAPADPMTDGRESSSDPYRTSHPTWDTEMERVYKGE